MTIQFTEEQQQALDTQDETPPCIIDPRSNVAYYLVAAREYEAIRNLLEEERRQKSIRGAGLRNAVGRMKEEP